MELAACEHNRYTSKRKTNSKITHGSAAASENTELAGLREPEFAGRLEGKIRTWLYKDYTCRYWDCKGVLFRELEGIARIHSNLEGLSSQTQ